MMRSVTRRFTSAFKEIPVTAKDKVLHFVALYNQDKSPAKVNLTIGAYKDEKGRSWVLPSVQKAIDAIRPKINCDYLPMAGDPEFINEMVKLGYGVEGGKLAGLFERSRVAALQSLSGTGAVWLSLIFMKEFVKSHSNKLYVSTPTWPIYFSLCQHMGIETESIVYYNEQKRVFDFHEYLNNLKKLPETSMVVMQVCGHNPTGHDPSPQQWQQVADVAKQKKFFVLLDMAYQGFVSGDAQKDSQPVRLFAQQGIRFALAQSCAKNFGLYGQRAGCMSVVAESEHQAQLIQDYLANRIRNTYSNNPRFGSDIVKTILQSKELTHQWHLDLRTMSQRLIKMRAALHQELSTLSPYDNWDYLLDQHGMFCYTHLKVPQIQKLRSEFSVHMLDSGRISICGLTTENVNQVAKHLNEVTRKQ